MRDLLMLESQKLHPQDPVLQWSVANIYPTKKCVTQITLNKPWIMLPFPSFSQPSLSPSLRPPCFFIHCEHFQSPLSLGGRSELFSHLCLWLPSEWTLSQLQTSMSQYLVYCVKRQTKPVLIIIAWQHSKRLLGISSELDDFQNGLQCMSCDPQKMFKLVLVATCHFLPLTVLAIFALGLSLFYKFWIPQFYSK